MTLGKSLFLVGLLSPDLSAEPLRGAERLGPLLFLRLLDMVKKKIKMCPKQGNRTGGYLLGSH